MDSLLKQPRVSFAGLDEDGDYNVENRQRKTGSSTRERKQKQAWFSGQMSHSDYSSDVEFATAVAAVAYAIKSLEDQEAESGRIQKNTDNRREESFSKPTDSKTFSRWFSSQDSKQGVSTGDNSLKNPSTSEKTKRANMTYESKVSVEKVPEKMPSAKSIKKTATFADKYPRKMDSEMYENEEDNKGGRSASLSTRSQRPNALSTKPVTSNKNSQMGPGKFNSEAEAWEKAEMKKIRDRYEKTNRKLLEWESEKKTKAKRRLERKEGELEERRARAIKEYRKELMKIDKIAGGARAHAEERKRNDESKILEKANKMKATGRLPSACPCFS